MVQKTHKQVPHISCDSRSKKNPVRSKKPVQVRNLESVDSVASFSTAIYN